ncbi:MAG: ParB/RepB/Spo0J family partition protein [Pseudomonadota bacterium]
MTRKPKPKSLGRGLSALLGDIEPVAVPEAEASAETVQEPDGAEAGVSVIPIELIHPNPRQPRRSFGDEDLAELAASIKAQGVIQPVVLRPHPEKTEEYQIVAGERRWRAAQRAQLHALPAVVRPLDDRSVLEIAIIENVQRVDLNALEEARGYAQLIERFGYTQEALARSLGKSRSHVANTLRLVALPEAVQGMLAEGQLSAGHARALLAASDPVSLAERVVGEGLTVRDVERLARGTAPAKPRSTPAPEKDADTRMLEGDLTAAIGMRVSLAPGAEGSGEIRIRYRDFEELDRLCEKLTR